MNKAVANPGILPDSSVPRRRFVAAGLTGAVGLLAGGSLFAKEPKKGEWIDSHVHVWTPDTVRYPLAGGFKKADMAPASFTPEELFHHSKPQLAHLPPHIPYKLPFFFYPRPPPLLLPLLYTLFTLYTLYTFTFELFRKTK